MSLLRGCSLTMWALLLFCVACNNSRSQSDSAAAPSSGSQAQSVAKTSSTAIPHACDLLNQLDAEHVFGAGAQLSRSEVDCALNPSEAKLLTLGTIGVSIRKGPDNWETAKKTQFAAFKDAKNVTGIGDDAIAFMKMLTVKKGNVQIEVVGSGYLDDKNRDEMMQYVAKQIVAKM